MQIPEAEKDVEDCLKGRRRMEWELVDFRQSPTELQLQEPPEKMEQEPAWWVPALQKAKF